MVPIPRFNSWEEFNAYFHPADVDLFVGARLG
jgi:hypothetical protein